MIILKAIGILRFMSIIPNSMTVGVDGRTGAVIQVSPLQRTHKSRCALIY